MVDIGIYLPQSYNLTKLHFGHSLSFLVVHNGVEIALVKLPHNGVKALIAIVFLNRSHYYPGPSF